VQAKLCRKDELADMKQHQTERRKQNLDSAAALPKEWHKSYDDNNMDLVDLEEGYGGP